MSASSARLRLLLIEPDGEIRQALVRRLGQHAFVEVVGEARNFATAMPRVVGLQPDWIVVGLGRETAAGLAFLRELMATRARCALALIMPAGVDTGHPDLLQVVRNLGAKVMVRLTDDAHGADELERLGGELLAQVLRAGRDGRSTSIADTAAAGPGAVATAPGSAVTVPPRATPVGAVATAAPPVAPPRPPAPVGAYRSRAARPLAVVGIGVSTGGPTALAAMLPELPADFPLPILIVQHMPPQFTKGLAESLSRTCRLPVAEAQAGDEVRAGRILIAPGGRHLRVVRRDHDVVTELTDDAPECSCRPSVDYLFRSLVAAYGGQVLGVMLTGMGEDGWIGSRLIVSAGGAVLAQDEASCTVYGMPRGPIQEGLAEAVPLERMAGRIFSSVGGVSCS